MYRQAEDKLFISTRAMEYIDEVKDELVETAERGVEIRILMRNPYSLSKSDVLKQEQTIELIQDLLSEKAQIRYSDIVEIRGCIIDPDANGKAIFLVEEEGVPFFLREAALTSHPGVAKALGSMFDLKWRFDSE